MTWASAPGSPTMPAMIAGPMMTPAVGPWMPTGSAAVRRNRRLPRRSDRDLPALMGAWPGSLPAGEVAEGGFDRTVEGRVGVDHGPQLRDGDLAVDGDHQGAEHL